MSKISLYSLAFATLGFASLSALLGHRPAVAQFGGSVPAYVKLQASTPGGVQTGHSNISGTSLAGQFISSGAQPGSFVISGTNSGTTTATSAIRGVSSAASGTVYGIWGTAISINGRGVFGEATATTGLNYGGRFESDSTGGRGVYGFASANTGFAYGVSGQSNSTTGRGVYGFANSNTGINYGGYFTSSSVDGYGVFATSDGPYGVYGEATATSGTSYGLYGTNAASNGAGVFGESTASSGTNFGGRFRSASTGGVAVSASTTSASGSTYAGRFENASTSGRGILGWAQASSGSTYGVWGRSDSSTGRGVFGEAILGTAGYFTSVTGEAGHFQTGGTRALTVVSGAGEFNEAAMEVHGGNLALRCFGTDIGMTSSGMNGGMAGFDDDNADSGYGVWGQTRSLDGTGVLGTVGLSVNGETGTGVTGYGAQFRGVYGFANNSVGTNYGVFGESSSTSGRGVLGSATAGSGTTYGVRGVNPNAAGYAIYSAGDLGCSGNKAFVIDHPFDPANKYLKHYCMEGPEPKNIYDGTVITDGSGWATVRLPGYFMEINKDPRVQLTVNDSSEDFVMVKMVGQLDGNTFRVRTSKGNVKVYWEVKATRNDAWNRAHGAPVEVQKSPEERGKYQHPELYGKPATAGIDYDARVVASRTKGIARKQ